MPLARLLAAALLLVLVAAARGEPQRCNGEAALCDRPFDRVVLPATHNAMSAQALGWQFPNQQYSIPDQLRLGIRGGRGLAESSATLTRRGTIAVDLAADGGFVTRLSRSR